MLYTNLEKVLNEISIEILDEYKKNLGESRIADSMTISVDDLTGSGSKYEVTLHLEHYWLYIENGRRQGAKPPPFKPILDWVVRKNLPLNYNGKLYTADQVANRIRFAISRNGIEAKNTLQKSTDNINNIEERIEEALTKDVMIELSNSINKIK